MQIIIFLKIYSATKSPPEKLSLKSHRNYHRSITISVYIAYDTFLIVDKARYDRVIITSIRRYTP